jgi:hypothetical protein
MFKPLLLSLTLGFSAYAVSQPLQLISTKQQTNLVELYTSEGCSSCPPAEHRLNNLINSPQLWKKIIPIALHVDYWDYIGWKDSYSVPQNAQRQRQYAKESGARTVYTPGFVNNGKEWRSWTNLEQLTPSLKAPGKLSATVNNNQIDVRFNAIDAIKGPFKLNVAILGFGLQTQIQAGENEGKQLKHDFVVIGQAEQISHTKHWKLKLPKTLNVNPTRKGIAIWVSTLDAQKPIQAVGGWL